jgi:hypothetical protein
MQVPLGIRDVHKGIYHRGHRDHGEKEPFPSEPCVTAVVCVLVAPPSFALFAFFAVHPAVDLGSRKAQVNVNGAPGVFTGG